jgi:hypothetical protein
MGFRISDYIIKNIKITNQKIYSYFYFCPPPLSFSVLSLLFHISVIHLISLKSLFSISSRSFLSVSLILLPPFSLCSIVFLSSFCTFFPLLPSFHPFLFLSFPSSSISLLSILSSFRLYSVVLPVPFSPFLLFRYIPCAQLSFSPHGTFCTSFPLLPSNTYFLSPRSYIQISPSFFFLLHFLPRHLYYLILYLLS